MLLNVKGFLSVSQGSQHDNLVRGTLYEITDELDQSYSCSKVVRLTPNTLTLPASSILRKVMLYPVATDHKAVVLATAATVLAIPLFSQSKSCIHSIRKLLVYLVLRVHVNNGSWSIDALCETTRFTRFSSSLSHRDLCLVNAHLGKPRLFIIHFRSLGLRNGNYFTMTKRKMSHFTIATCATAVKEKKIRASTAEASFVSTVANS